MRIATCVDQPLGDCQINMTEQFFSNLNPVLPVKTPPALSFIAVTGNEISVAACAELFSENYGICNWGPLAGPSLSVPVVTK